MIFYNLKYLSVLLDIAVNSLFLFFLTNYVCEQNIRFTMINIQHREKTVQIDDMLSPGMITLAAGLKLLYTK